MSKGFVQNAIFVEINLAAIAYGEETVAFCVKNLTHERMGSRGMVFDFAALLAGIVLQTPSSDSERGLNGRVQIFHKGMELEMFCRNGVLKDASLGSQGRFAIYNNFSSRNLHIKPNMVQAALPVMAVRYVYRDAARHNVIVKGVELFRFLADPFLNRGGRHHVPVSDLQRPFHKRTSCSRPGHSDRTGARDLR